MDLQKELKRSLEQGKISPSIFEALDSFYQSYCCAVEGQWHSIEEYAPNLCLYLQFVEEQLAAPYQFSSYNKMVTSPIDYYKFGLDFLRPLIIFSRSKILGLHQIDAMELQLAKKENVILFANHQTEPDPQAISLLLEQSHPKFAREMIIVAGHRVTTDPMAIPFSLGRNLLCIYSKKHLEFDQEKKQERLLHNQRTMRVMGELLAEGGKCIYVAPSGGRDRLNEKGEVEVAPFDSQSVEMFHLIAKKSGKPTHFYPLSLATYALLPPPNSIKKDLGEERYTKCTPIHLAFGEEIDMNCFPGCSVTDKKEFRALRAKYIWSFVEANYKALVSKSLEKYPGK